MLRNTEDLVLFMDAAHPTQSQKNSVMVGYEKEKTKLLRK
ncbi:hypothetical protein IFVP408_C2120305 [Vibrio parahaemolyticus]